MQVSSNSPSLTGVGLIKTANDIQTRDITKLLESADVSKIQQAAGSSPQASSGLGKNLDIKA